ncbi:MAG: DUF4263 domain-containing protein [Candidatus Azambacteria bacterium]|nr:DUF4263 domain-containing protein [Candidatus Azambacteria bacterium]
MNFNANNFKEVQYDNLKLYFDKGYIFHEHFKHKQKTRRFPFYRNILKFLEESPNTKIYFTLNEEIKTFQQVSDGFLLNMCAYLDFCRTIASRTGGRLKAFLGQNVDLLKVTATDTEKANFIKANATEKNILDAIKILPDEAQINIVNSLDVASVQKDQPNPEINSTDFISAFSKFLTNKDVQSAFYSNLPKIQIDILKSHIEFLRANLDKNETFIQNWIDGDNGKFRKQRCLIFGLEYVDPKREGQVAGKKFDLLAEHDLEHYVIFELKSPKDDVFKVVETETVAGGVSTEYCLSPQLSRAIPEILGYKKMYDNAQGEELQKFGVKVKKPISKCVIILGTRKEDIVWKENFERICSCLNGIELLTYNNLIDRLENTVNNLEENTKII